MSEELTLAETYSPTNPVPLRSYGVMLGMYGAAVAGMLMTVAKRRSVPSIGNTVLLGLATYKLSRIVSKAKITGAIRAPFTRTQGSSGPAEVRDEPRGGGLQRAIGDLISCPFCLAPWIAASLIGVHLVRPESALLLSRIFGAVAISDLLQKTRAKL